MIYVARARANHDTASLPFCFALVFKLKINQTATILPPETTFRSSTATAKQGVPEKSRVYMTIVCVYRPSATSHRFLQDPRETGATHTNSKMADVSCGATFTGFC